MYVFLDGQLVCDLGGVHASAGAVVDLREYLPVDDPNSVGQHELVVYYLERGASGSTCWMHMELPHPMTPSTKDPTVTYRNVRVSKTVTGENAPDVKFPIQISIKNYAGSISSAQFKYTDSNSNTGILKSGDIVMLGADDYVLIHDIPDGYQVSATEDLDGFDSWHLDSSSRMSCVVGPGGDAISVKNVYTPKGSLFISKQVVDASGAPLNSISDVFKFNVRFTGQDGNDYAQPLSCIVYDGSDSRFATSRITSPCVVEIPANGYAVIDGFDSEVQYSITEVSCDNYKLVSSEGASGTISTKQEAAKFVNCYNPGGPELPATGGPGTFRLMIAGMSLLLLAFCEIRRRKTAVAC